MKLRLNPFRSLVVPAMAATSLLFSTAGAATLYWETSAATSGAPLKLNFPDSGELVGFTAFTLFTFSSTDLDHSDLNAITLTGQSPDASFGTGSWLFNSSSLQVRLFPEAEAGMLGGLTVGPASAPSQMNPLGVAPPASSP